MSQTERIRKHLESGKSLTPIQALRKFDCLRLGARIWDLRKAGMKIITNMITRNGKTFAEYIIE